jgi:hypothetical protein
MNPAQYELKFLFSLFLTIVSECTLLIVLIRFRFFKELKKHSLGSILLIFGLASAATLPYLWFVLPAFLHNKVMFHIIGELSVVLAESLIYFVVFKIDYKRMLLLSFLCNLFSYLIGLMF